MHQRCCFHSDPGADAICSLPLVAVLAWLQLIVIFVKLHLVVVHFLRKRK